MKYIGEFESLDLKKYKVEIETKNGSGTQNLILGGNPFITEMNIDEKQIYSPIKGTTATIEYITEDYYFDIYSENPTETKVTLFETTNGSNNIVWIGYVVPQMFSQSFKSGPQTINIDCVDSLSVLENINFISVEKEILSFEEVLKKVLKNVDIKYLYVSSNVQLNSATANETILDKLYISEMNFFDDKADEETDDDVCWNCLDVVSEICQYLGYVATMIGNDLYFLDYDAIKNNNNNYWRYDLKNGGNPTSVTLSDNHKIGQSDHFNSNANVNLDKIYNKVSVKADTFVYDDLLSGGSSTNITNMDGSGFSTSMGVFGSFDYIWGEVFPADDDQQKAMDVWVDAHNDGGGGNTGGKHNYYDFVAMKFLKKKNSKFYIYNSSWNDISSTYENNFAYPDLNKNNGAMYVKYFTKNIDKTKTSKTSEVQTQFRNYYNELKSNPNVDSGKYLDYILDKNGIHNISWTEAIVMTNLQATQRPNESDWYKYPYYETECEGSLFQGGDNSAMIIQGQFYWHCIGSSSSVDAYPMEYKDFKLDKKNWINPNVDMFIPATLQWGNLWWNGNDWQSSKCGFKLNWLASEYRDDNNSRGKKETIEEWKCQKTVMQPQPLTNTVDWRFGTTEEGCLITLPKGQNISGKPKLTLYRPVSGRVWKSRKDWRNGDNNSKLSGDWNTNNGVRWPWFFVALIGLKFKAIMGDQSYDGVNDTDTIYTNLLENNSIEELETINFKIHTFDDKQNSYGSVGLNGGSDFADKLYNKALANEEKSWYDSNGDLATNGMRQEEHLIYKLYKQYSEPSRMLDCNIKLGIIKPYGLYTDTTLNNSYIVSKFGTDYRMAYNNITLLEKK